MGLNYRSSPARIWYLQFCVPVPARYLGIVGKHTFKLLAGQHVEVLGRTFQSLGLQFMYLILTVGAPFCLANVSTTASTLGVRTTGGSELDVQIMWQFPHKFDAYFSYP